mmetsp:Transcript_31162/g.85232  ORF Transcript_31162/g.85232 Transcript_31162/m.85232 type:complete len:258 (-) Transcript_31162:301-1074(-)
MLCSELLMLDSCLCASICACCICCCRLCGVGVLFLGRFLVAAQLSTNCWSFHSVPLSRAARSTSISSESCPRLGMFCLMILTTLERLLDVSRLMPPESVCFSSKLISRVSTICVSAAATMGYMDDPVAGAFLVDGRRARGGGGGGIADCWIWLWFCMNCICICSCFCIIFICFFISFICSESSFDAGAESSISRCALSASAFSSRAESEICDVSPLYMRQLFHTLSRSANTSSCSWYMPLSNRFFTVPRSIASVMTL